VTEEAKTAKKQIANKTAIEAAGYRNGFIPAAMQKLSQIAIWNSALSMIVLMVAIGVYAFRPTPQSFAITPDGHIVAMKPLSDDLGTEAIAGFISNAVVSAYSMDFVNWDKQIGALSPMFTPDGFNAFTKAITPVKERVVDGRYITSIGIIKPPIIVKSAVINGVMKYRIVMEILIAYEGQTKRIDPQHWKVDVIAERVPFSTNPVGIAISRIDASPL